ncbi:hypothetical protein PT974_01938 [Cladobotryum mycophilum]|uniref:Extracellular membrane protein CFEM domain-containing protein n=1 Tax=Cladobotryum mycophilum TaxID=491253 RepID=A0ABR0SXW0_9HYPO
MTKPRLWTSLPLFLFLLSPALAVTPDFSFYPPNAIDCLNDAAAISKCSAATYPELNSCLCGNGGNWVLNSAACVGQKDPTDIVKVYTTMAQACADSKTPMDVSQSDFYAAAEGKLTTTSATPTPTPTPTSTSASASKTPSTTIASTASITSITSTTSKASATPTQTNADPNASQGLSTGATVGIAIGASIGGVAIIAGLAIFLIRRKNRRGEEAHPMLPQYGGKDARYSAATTFPPTEPSPGFSPYSNEAKRPAWASPNQSPDPSYRHSGTTWTSSQVHYKGPYAPPEGGAEWPQQHSSQVFEMDGAVTTTTLSQGPVEMQGSVPPPRRDHQQS